VELYGGKISIVLARAYGETVRFSGVSLLPQFKKASESAAPKN
jgi:hypothetical protein